MRSKASNVKNNREFEAINKEIEMQQLEVKLAEKHIKDATDEISEKAMFLEKAKKTIAAKEGILNTKKMSLKRSLLLLKKKKSILIKCQLKQKNQLIHVC